MLTLFLSKTIENNKEFSGILTTVDAGREDSQILLHSQAVLEQYKMVSEVISSVEIDKKEVRRMTMKEIMQESVFHGKSRFGQNFIA